MARHLEVVRWFAKDAVARVLRNFLSGLRAHGGAVHAAPRARPLHLAGRDRPVTVIRGYADAAATKPVYRGLFAGWTDGGNRVVVVSCGSPHPPHLKRCPALLEWAATHDRPPPHLAGAPKPRATAAAAAAAAAWVPEKTFAGTGSKAQPGTTRDAFMRCPDADILIDEAHDDVTAKGGYAGLLRSMAPVLLAQYRAGAGTGDAPAEPDRRAFTGMVADFDAPGHGALNLSCGGLAWLAARRCPALLAWMADHPSMPPDLPLVRGSLGGTK